MEGDCIRKLKCAEFPAFFEKLSEISIQIPCGAESDDDALRICLFRRTVCPLQIIGVLFRSQEKIRFVDDFIVFDVVPVARDEFMDEAFPCIGGR